jgi:hypothetical protein
MPSCWLLSLFLAPEAALKGQNAADFSIVRFRFQPRKISSSIRRPGFTVGIGGPFNAVVLTPVFSFFSILHKHPFPHKRAKKARPHKSARKALVP